MKVVDPGHTYELGQLDVGPYTEEPHLLVFVKRSGPNFPGNFGHYGGTTLQEVLRAVVDRLKYVDNQLSSPYTQMALRHAKEAIYCLELRAAERHNRAVTFGVDGAVYGDCCAKCLHVGCQGLCHD